MRAVLEFLASLAGLLKVWLRQKYGERREADRADAGGEWVHQPAGEAGNLLLWIKGEEAGR